MAKPEKKTEAGAPLWYISYGDMVTNMLCFFVMLFSFSTLDSPKKRMEVQQREDKYFAVFTINRERGASQWLTSGGKGIMMAANPQRNPIPRIVRKVRKVLQKVSMLDQLHVLSDDSMVKIKIPSKVLFKSGTAEMVPGSETVLEALIPVVSEVLNDVRIDGHTDEQPARNTIFPSNWELSAARACTVVRFYTETIGLDASRFSAQGFAENRPQVPNISEANREKNRRVEINILVTKRLKREAFKWE